MISFHFLSSHYGIASTFDPVIHTVGTNGNLSGKDDTPDGAYKKTYTDTEGAVYITTGSAGKISGGSLDHGQKLTVKFLTDKGAIDDYFTIHKPDDSV